MYLARCSHTLSDTAMEKNQKFYFKSREEKYSAIRKFVDGLIINSFKGKKTALEMKGVSNAFWVTAKKMGYIELVTPGIFKPTIDFTDDQIALIMKNANEIINGGAKRKTRKVHPELFSHTPEPINQKVTPEMMLQVVKHFREHPDMIDNMLRSLQEQLEDQFNLQ